MTLPPKAERRAGLLLRQVCRALPVVLANPGGEAEVGRSAPDALAHQVLMLILRRRATLDWLIDGACSRPPADRLRHVLWWALAEALFLDGLPLPVIVDTAVESLKDGSRGAASFANAVLRRLLAREREAVLAAVQSEAPAWVRLDLGQALYTVWAGRLDAATLAELAARLQQPAPLVARLRQGGEASPATGLEPLAAVPWAPGERLWRVVDAPAFFASPAWARRAFYLQDPSTLLAPKLLAAGPGERVADLCCAPGGKAVLLSEAVGPTGCLVCVDRSAGRMVRVRENLGTASQVRLLVGDARNAPFPDEHFDALLLDVPCSNTGVVRRRPDVRWHFSASGRDDLARTQASILAASARLVRPGGRLVYSTCSLEPEENGGVVHAFLAQHPDYVLETEHLLYPADDHDGAYAARLGRQVP